MVRQMVTELGKARQLMYVDNLPEDNLWIHASADKGGKSTKLILQFAQVPIFNKTFQPSPLFREDWCFYNLEEEVIPFNLVCKLVWYSHGKCVIFSMKIG